MSLQFVAEIRMFGCNFAPSGWAQCNGQLIPISQNTALFSLLGIMYGGDGKTTFALPNLQGRSPLQWGHGPGLSYYDQGQMGGQNAVTLLSSEIPSHTHTLNSKTGGSDVSPSGDVWANPNGRPAPNYFATAIGTPQAMSPQALQAVGGNQPHNNLMPYLTVTFCIALQGVFPPRT